MSKPGFELQWKTKLDNPPRGVHGLGQGVTATGVTIFVPMSLVTGSSNTIYGVDNDLRLRRLEAAVRGAAAAAEPPTVPAASQPARRASSRLNDTSTIRPPSNPGAADPRAIAACSASPARVCRLKAGRPDRGDPASQRLHRDAGRGARGAAPAVGPRASSRRRHRSNQPADRIPGSSRGPMSEASARPRHTGTVSCFVHPASSMSSRATACCTCSVCPRARTCSGPRRSCPPTRNGHRRSRWARRCTPRRSGNCGGAPPAICAIDLDSDAKPVVSWKTDGGPVVGAVAFTSDGTLIAAIGAGQDYR